MEVPRNRKRILLSVCIIRDLLKMKNDLRPECPIGQKRCKFGPGLFQHRQKDAESVLKTGSGAETRAGPDHQGPGLQKTRAPGIENPVLYLREERLLVCGEIYGGAAGPAQGSAGSPADLPLVLQRAVKAEQTASVPLPGTVDVSRCSRVTADIGKCSVCGIAKAVWIDREAGVKLCEHCYGRGVREDAQEAGVV